jgi:hypothetical protein
VHSGIRPIDNVNETAIVNLEKEKLNASEKTMK